MNAGKIHIILLWAAALAWREHSSASVSQLEPQLLAGSPLLIRLKGRGQPKGAARLSGGCRPVTFILNLSINEATHISRKDFPVHIHHTMKQYMWDEGRAPHILNL
jgi:hypothetical protein